MKNKTGLYMFLSFIAGAAIGVASVYSYFKNEMMEELERNFRSKRPDETKEETSKTEDKEGEPVNEKPTNSALDGYEKTVKDLKYVNYSDADVEQKRRIVEIEEEEDGLYEDYAKENLIVFSDGKLIDGNGFDVDDPAELLGPGTLERFMKRDDETLYIRNDETKYYYEVSKDHRTYEVVYGK